MKEILAIGFCLAIFFGTLIANIYLRQKHAEAVNEQTIRCVAAAKSDTIAMSCFNKN